MDGDKCLFKWYVSVKIYNNIITLFTLGTLTITNKFSLIGMLFLL